MDVISHWLWGMAATRGKVSWKVAGPMGVLPDLVAFIPASIYTMANGLERVSVDDDTVTSDMPAIAWDIYQWSHSFTIVAILYLSAFLILKNRGCENSHRMSFFFVLPWIIHILTDIPGHTIHFFPTPFLYPFSEFMFDGVRWSTPWFFFTNVALLAGWWFLILKRERDQSIEETAETAARA